MDKCRVLNFFSLGGFLLRKLALFRVPYALRATFIPSLRFGTGYASTYNPCHCLKLKNSKLNLIKSMFQTSRIFTEEMREIFKHDKRFIQLGMKQSCSARGVCWDTASMESANGVLNYNKFVKSKFKKRQGLSLSRVVSLAY